MTFSHATAADRAELIRLWMDCFGDAEDYVRLYADHSFAPERVFVLRQTQIAAMCVSFPVTYLSEEGDERQGAYLYAVCTRPDQRGKGLCRSLMRQTEEMLRTQDCTFTCLKAASPALTAMYERMGYRTSLTNREYNVSAAGASPACPFNMEAVSPERYYALRQCALRGGFIDYAPDVLAHQARLGQLLCIDGGNAIAATERFGNTVMLKEYLGDETLLPSLAERLGVNALTVRMPGDTPFAMAKSLTDAPEPAGYFAFAFD